MITQITILIFRFLLIKKVFFIINFYCFTFRIKEIKLLSII